LLWYTYSMNRNTERGIIKPLILATVGICVVFIVFAALAKQFVGTGSFSSGGYTNPVTTYEVATNPLLDFGTESYGTYGSYTPSSGASRGSTQTNGSSFAGSIRFSIGNTYTIQPNEEYLTLTNNSSNAIDITGWKLTNSRGTRPIENQVNSYVYPSGESATIGQGTQFLDPSGKYVTGDIALKPGDTAYITTGRSPSNFPLPITTSFRENICLGYLDTYPFEPQVYRNCPLATEDPAINTVTDECFDYLRTLNRCTDPTKLTGTYEKDRYDLLTSHCKNYMRTRLNYPSCVANYRNSANFSTKTWRVYLGKSMEMWASSRETITLYDKAGKVVSQISY
jgi:hypothetical protein